MNLGDFCRIDELKNFDVFRDDYVAGKNAEDNSGKNDFVIVGHFCYLVINPEEKYPRSEFKGEKLTYLGSVLFDSLEVIKAKVSILIGV
jgi:hypothetical protein